MREYEIKVQGETLPLIFTSLANANFFKRYLVGEMDYAESDIEVRRRVDQGTGGECVE